MDMHPVIVRVLKWKLGEKLSKQEEHRLAVDFYRLVCGDSIKTSETEMDKMWTGLANALVGDSIADLAEDVGGTLSRKGPRKTKKPVKAAALVGPIKSVLAHSPTKQPERLVDAISSIMEDNPDHHFDLAAIINGFKTHGWTGKPKSIKNMLYKYSSMKMGMHDRIFKRAGRGQYVMR